MPREILKYINESLTVVWQPKLCIHSAKCFKGLPQVFDPKARPWVKIDGADAAQIIKQVNQCPSGALSIGIKDEPTPLSTEKTVTSTRIMLQANGPLLVEGSCIIAYPDGKEETREGNIALCRCGASANKPYCDGSHRKVGFTG